MDLDKLFDPTVQSFIQKNLGADIRELALKAQGKFDLPLGFLMNQINGRQKAKKKLPTWWRNSAIVYPDDISLQQCSSEISAELKTKNLAKGKTCIDLGGGFGIDTYFLAHKFEHVIYVEQNKNLCQIVAHNFKTLGIDHVTIANTTGEEFIQSFKGKVDLIFIDPARRDVQQQRIFQFEDCSPNILEMEEFLQQKGENLLIKASPLIDIRSAYEQFVSFRNCQVIGINNECKEVMFSNIETLRNFYNEITIQKEHSKISFISYNRQFAVISFYLNKKIKELELQITNLLNQPVKIVGKIYSKDKNTFTNIYSDLICLEKYNLN